MHLNQSIILLGFCAFFAEGVTLIQHTKPKCGGKKFQCTNIPSNVCCQSTKRNFASGSCRGCTSTDFHITWVKSGNQYCGTSRGATNGGGCISGSSNLRGHNWCRLCRTKRDDPTPAAPCIGTVEPDMIEIGNSWFSVNETVPEDDRDRLWSLWDEDMPDVPEHLLQYVTVDEEGDDDDDEFSVDNI